MDVEVSKLKFNREKAILLGEARSFVESAEWEIREFEFPILSVILARPTPARRLGFRFQCDNWDEQPPSLTLFDPESPTIELVWGKWPKSGWHAGDQHDNCPRPFLCLPGIREYHVHPNHLTDHWANLRGKASYTLRYIVDRVHQKFRATND